MGVRKHDWFQPLPMWGLVIYFLLATALPRFGTLWHTHSAGEATHTHNISTLVRERRVLHTHHVFPHEHGPSHGHNHRHDHAHPHHVFDHDMPAHSHAHAHQLTNVLERRVGDATPHRLHAHYFDESLPPTSGVLSLQTLVLPVAVLYGYVKEPLPACSLISPTARAPPSCLRTCNTPYHHHSQSGL